jgi:NAD(P)-dependent dehydrogenase (short-subunit alcohol dehydrogenase family)
MTPAWLHGSLARMDAAAPDAPVRRVLVTGSSGSVARLILPLLREDGYDLRLADRTGDGDERADLSDIQACHRVVAGMDAVVHLAGYAKEAPAERLVADNSLAVVNMLRSAADARVSHFVFASSMHVMGMYRRDERFDETDAPRPDSHYAASKLHGEALCRLYQEKTGLAVTCLRLGSVTEREEESDPGAWISPEDVAAMIRIALSLPPSSFEVFHAVADYDGSPLPPSRASRYGYRCTRHGGSYAAAMQKVQSWWHENEWARARRGASFAAEGIVHRDTTGPNRTES